MRFELAGSMDEAEIPEEGAREVAIYGDREIPLVAGESTHPIDNEETRNVDPSP